jgi:hypothetical protein
LDDDCDGTTDDEAMTCDECMLDPESSGREYCDDGLDNDCDGLTDPLDCLVPCQDLGGLCQGCETAKDCWPGLVCQPVSGGDPPYFCLNLCPDSSWCEPGFACDLERFVCLPTSASCAGLEAELPDPSCADEPLPDAGPDTDTGTDTSDPVDAAPDSAPLPPEGSAKDSCNCTTPGGQPHSHTTALGRLFF